VSEKIESRQVHQKFQQYLPSSFEFRKQALLSINLKDEFYELNLCQIREGASLLCVALLTTIDHAVAGTSASFYFAIMLRGLFVFCAVFTVISARGVFVEPSHHKFDYRRLHYNRTSDGKLRVLVYFNVEKL
jgi:hypothetical protein